MSEGRKHAEGAGEIRIPPDATTEEAVGAMNRALAMSRSRGTTPLRMRMQASASGDVPTQEDLEAYRRIWGGPGGLR
jgi:hypothetical protein